MLLFKLPTSKRPTELRSDFKVKYFFQIREVPDDFFVDIVSSNNFLVTILTRFFATIRHNSETIDPNLRLKADRFKAHLTQKFNWDFDEEELDEDLPVVVETE